LAFTINCPVTPIRSTAIKLKRELTIRRPLPEVFAFIADLRNDPQWNSAVAEMELLTPESPSLGARYRQVAPGFIGDKMQQQLEVTEYQTDRKLTYRASGPPFPFVVSYEFDGFESGTRLRMTGDMQVPGALFLLTPLIKSSVGGQTDAAFRQLKGLLEGQLGFEPATGAVG
jgi:hypothetical protein